LMISILDMYYIWSATNISLIGSDSLGAEHSFLFSWLFWITVIYTVIDFIWISIQPSCVIANHNSIKLHHFVTLVYFAIPFYYPQFSWHTGICLSVEINTLLLILRRKVSRGDILYRLVDASFFLTWMLLRLILSPVLVIFFWFEYNRLSNEIGSHVNLVALAPMLQILLTFLVYKWTFDMLSKRFKAD